MGKDILSNDDVIHISGPLSFTTVPALNKNNRVLIKQKPKIIFDFSQVTLSDNTGVAFLVALASYAKGLEKKILFINLPQQLLRLVEANGVKDILPIG